MTRDNETTPRPCVVLDRGLEKAPPTLPYHTQLIHIHGNRAADFPCHVTVNAELWGELGWRGWVKTQDGRIPLDRVKSIYYRRPTGFVFPDDVTGSDLAFATAEARRGFGGLFFSLATRWVNHPGRVADAETSFG